MLQRIRLDPDGLITQTERGSMRRIRLAREQVNEIDLYGVAALRAIMPHQPSISEFFDSNGRLTARFEKAMDDADCLNRPLRIYYGIEPRCNLHCEYCGPRDWHSRFVPGGQQQERFLLREIAESGAFQVQLTGGEIGLRGFDLLGILNDAQELGLAVILATNGVWSCIDRKDAFLVALANFSNIIQTKISIDGTPEFHDSVRGAGTYAETVDTLARVSACGLSPRISATVFRESCDVDNLEHLVMLAQKHDAALQVIPVRATGRATNMKLHAPSRDQLLAYTQYATRLRRETGASISFNFDILEPDHSVPVFDVHRPVSCGAPLWGVHVSHQGEVFPCGFSQDVGAGAFLAGVVSRERSLLDIWLHSEVLMRVRSAGKDPECQGCGYYGQGCWGGCWVVGWLETGRVAGMDPYCFRSYMPSGGLKSA